MAKKRVFVAGHLGMVGQALCRQLTMLDSVELMTATRGELDLTDQQAVKRFLMHQQIDEIYVAAAKVGGIYANENFPAEFIYQNLMIEANLIHSAHLVDVQKMLFLGSSCIYPKLTPQPISEEALLTGPLEPTNEPYAIAKIAGIKLCESYNRQYGRDYRCAMPTNLYGPYDNFHPQYSHVIPALIGKFYRAIEQGDKFVEIWGSGNARREFMHVDDLAAACLHIMSISKQNSQSLTDPRCSHINIGTGIDCSIREVAELLKAISGFTGEFCFDENKLEGTPVKRLDVTRLNKLGWPATTSLELGMRNAWDWYVNNVNLKE